MASQNPPATPENTQEDQPRITEAAKAGLPLQYRGSLGRFRLRHKNDVPYSYFVFS